MNKDEAKGKLDQAKGKTKQEIGDATGNDRLRDEGLADEASGDVREGFGNAKEKTGETLKDLGDDIKK